MRITHLFLFLQIFIASLTLAQKSAESDMPFEIFSPNHQELVRQISNFNYERQFKKNFRFGRCLITPGQNFNDFGEECFTKNSMQRESILLWGDSQMAAFYSGYADYFGQEKIIQLTSTSCPPILGVEFPVAINCPNTNNSILEYIKKNKPKLIVLSGMWVGYEKWKEIDQTLAELKRLDIHNVHIIGPIPFYEKGLPKEVIEQINANTLSSIPDRIKTGLNPDYPKAEPYLRDISKKYGFRYLSPQEKLCNSSGCLTHTKENTLDSFINFDNTHLTKKGSIYLVNHFYNSNNTHEIQKKYRY